MSNELKDYLWDKLSDILLEANVVDKVFQTIVQYNEWAGTVCGTKDGTYVKYTVFMDDDGNWKYELINT